MFLLYLWLPFGLFPFRMNSETVTTLGIWQDSGWLRVPLTGLITEEQHKHEEYVDMTTYLDRNSRPQFQGLSDRRQDVPSTTNPYNRYNCNLFQIKLQRYPRAALSVVRYFQSPLLFLQKTNVYTLYLLVATVHGSKEHAPLKHRRSASAGKETAVIYQLYTATYNNIVILNLRYSQ